MKNPERVAVIGGGWFGCHIALELLQHDVDFVLFEAESELFLKASGNNQFRLHQGFHYPRSKKTRIQSSEGFHRFTERYPDLSSPTPGRNLYLVPHHHSVLDFETFVDVMVQSNLEFETVEHIPSGLYGIEGAISTRERVLETSAAVQFFHEALGNRIRLGNRVEVRKDQEAGFNVGNEFFDWVIDATWGHLTQPPGVVYEPTLLLYMDTKGFEDALTLMDGDLWSLYPTEHSGIFSLSHVGFTPLGSFSSSSEATKCMNSLTSEDIVRVSAKIICEVATFFPAVEEMNQVGVQLSMKSKMTGQSDSRISSIYAKDQKISVFSGKIDGAFDVADQILALMMDN